MSKKKSTIAPVLENTVETPVVETPTKQRGRPILEDSARQIKLAKQAELIASGGTISRGRPSNPESKRQLKFTERANKLAAGFTITRGRPKAVKTEEVPTEVVVTPEM